MTFLADYPALQAVLPLVKLIAVFVCMLTGIRLKMGLSPSILFGSIFGGFLFGMSSSEWLHVAFAALCHEQAVQLGIIIVLIMLFSDLMEKTGQTAELMENISGYLKSPRLRLVFFPLLIGLLPMPGGAIFSAPMVKSASDKLDVPAVDRVLVNYWFRHVWETWWPLYPGLILAVSICQIPITTLAVYGFPGMLVMLALGWLFVLRPGVLPLHLGCVGGGESPRSAGAVLRAGLPLLVAVGGAVVFELVIGVFFPGVPFEWGVMLALFAAICTTLTQRPQGVRAIGQSLLGKHLWGMLGVILAIFIFKDVLKYSGAVEALSALGGGRAALFACAVVLPYVVGLVSGITMAYVGATFPLLVGVITQLGMQDQMMPFVMLAIFSGFTGIMSTPLHICFILTCQYFNVEIGTAWRRLVAPCCLLIVSGFVYFGVLELFQS